MHPELFEIPFIGLPVWSFGFMMVVGFMVALAIIKLLRVVVNLIASFFACILSDHVTLPDTAHIYCGSIRVLRALTRA